jgi:hypothetical protein
MTAEAPEKPKLIETVVALLIAFVTVFGAIVAWRASVADDGAGDADFAGLKASLKAEETRALNFVNAYEHYGAYTTYARYQNLGLAIGNELDAGGQSEDEAFALARQQAEAYDLAKANQYLFPTRFINRNGVYGLQREMGELWADAAKENDLNPAPQYAEADTLRSKTNRLLGTLTLMGVGLVLFTLVEVVNDKMKYAMVGLGLLVSVGGLAWALMIELAK